jgi:hypothetical protein
MLPAETFGKAETFLSWRIITGLLLHFQQSVSVLILLIHLYHRHWNQDLLREAYENTGSETDPMAEVLFLRFSFIFTTTPKITMTPPYMFLSRGYRRPFSVDINDRTVKMPNHLHPVPRFITCRPTRFISTSAPPFMMGYENNYSFTSTPSSTEFIST